MKKRYSIAAVLGLMVVAAAAWGPIVSNVEQAKYTVAKQQGNIEIRDYEPMIVAEVEVEGERREAIRQGFRIIADYIFGNNVKTQEVAMTAPVTQVAGEEIAMTAPVTQLGGQGRWKVRFMMPGGSTLESLPQPRDERVQLKEIAGKRFAVIRFTGWGSNENLQEHSALLERYIQQQKLQAISGPTYAFFNPPWTLPFLRRNEVMVEVAP